MRWTIEQRGDRWAVITDDGSGMTDSAHWRSEEAASARALTLNGPLVAVTAAAGDDERGAAFYAVLAIDDWMTEDGRYVETFDWADGILPFMALTENQGGGHWGAELGGRIETIEKMGDGRRVFATGTFDPTEVGTTTETQVRAQSLRFVSVDPAAVEYVEVITKVDTDGWPLDGYVRFTTYTIGGATACPFPAIRMAIVWCEGMDAPAELAEPLPDAIPIGVPEIEGVSEGDVVVIIAGADLPDPERGILVADPEHRALVASAAPSMATAVETCHLTDGCGGPALPPRSFFADPRFTEPTPGRVDRDGHTYGHMALWNVQHRGFLNYQARAVLAPRNHSGYAQFQVHTTYVACCDQASTCGHTRESIKTGVLTLGTGHADKAARSIGGVLAHYENTGLAVADVVVGEDAHGIWYSGVLRPGMSDDRVREFLGASPSGDWRGIGGALELCAVLMVNSGGFPIVASAYEDHGEVVTLFAGFEATPVEDADALVASLGGGRPRSTWPFRYVEGFNSGALKAMVDAALDRRLGPIERDLDLLRPMTAEALTSRIDAALVAASE